VSDLTMHREPRRAPSPSHLGLARDGQSKMSKSATADFDAGEGWGEGSRDAAHMPIIHPSSDSDLRDPSSGATRHLLPQGEKGSSPKPFVAMTTQKGACQ